MLIFHGDNIIQSRNRLKEEIDTAKNAGKSINRAVAKQLSEAQLEELLGSSDLFGTDKLIIIEELHSLPASNRKKSLITMLGQDAHDGVVLWEKRPLTKTMLKKFPDARTEEFKASSSLFKWLDALGSSNQQLKLKLLSESLQSDGEYYCFLMLIRQIRFLIQAKSGGKVAGPPFVVGKIKDQSRHFSLEQLLNTHAKLYKIDSRQKTSRSPLTLAQELDLMTLSL